MNKKLVTLISLILLLTVILSACGTKEASDEGKSDDSKKSKETITLKLADIHPEGYPTVVASEKFAELVEEKTDGRYKIDVYAGGQLGGEKSILEELQLGSMDLGRVNG